MHRITPLVTGVNIREAGNGDISSIKSLVFGILDEYGLAADVTGTDADLDDIEANYADRGGVFHVLVDNGDIVVGTVGLYPLDDETIEFRKMYFDRSIRGRGLGNAVLARAIEMAREMGYLRVYLETASVLKEAVHLYEKFGFRPVGEKHTPRCDQAYVLELRRGVE
jgi:putative acetyltransferase